MKDSILELSKTPPQDIDAEEAVLSAIFIRSKGIDEIGALQPEDFYKGAHKKIFSAMLALRRKKEPVDLVTVAQELIKNEELESIGGAGYLSAISESAPVALNVYHYSKIIQDLAKARELIKIAGEIISEGFELSDIEDYISRSQSKILQVQTTTSKDKIYNMEELMLDAIDRIEEAQKTGSGSGFNFGMPLLDSLMNVSGSKLMLFAGRPGMGKTALALSVSMYLAYRDIKVGFISIEMDKESLADRLLSIESDINTLAFYAKDSLSDNSKQIITNAASNLSSLPIYIDDADCKIQDVERKCRKLKKMGCEIIFIDQLSKIRGLPGQKKFETYTDNCNSIALLKKELRMPIGLLCQLNRKVEDRGEKIPTLSDLKQTGMLEEDADMVFLLYRPGYYDDKIDQSKTDIILAKNRQGATGVEQHVLFNRKRGMFTMVSTYE